jgi:exosome complex component RRP42
MNKDQLKNITQFLDEDIRFDGRKKEEYRNIVIENDIAVTSEGSAKVQLGDTIVIAGVKIEAGSPFPDTPDEGVLMVGVELSPIANENYETGPPGFDAIELARVTDRGIRESKAIDVKKLCLIPGEKVLMINVDINVLNDDGNLFDVCSLAAISAIKNARIPKITKENTLDYSSKTDNKLPINKFPIGVTVYKIGNYFLIDPTLKEMNFIDARLTVTSIEDKTICAMQKGNQGTLMKDQIADMIELGLKKSDELRKFI